MQRFPAHTKKDNVQLVKERKEIQIKKMRKNPTPMIYF